jgi:uncharacterized protein with NRDE domain
MCLIVIAHQTSERWPLVVAANRDELYARPTRPAHQWEEDARIVGGRDLQAGGSWLAARRGGRFAAVTNVRGVGRAEGGGPSRGLLVSDFVRGDERPLDYARVVAEHGADYAGFHLIVHDRGVIVHCGNSEPPQAIDPGLFAISNAPPGEHWPKVDHGRHFLAAAIERASSADELANDLLRSLGTPRGGAIQDEVFVATPAYGTRSSTVIIADLFVEKNYGVRSPVSSFYLR